MVEIWLKSWVRRSAKSIRCCSFGPPDAPIAAKLRLVISIDVNVSSWSCSRLSSAAPLRASRFNVQYLQASATNSFLLLRVYLPNPCTTLLKTSCGAIGAPDGRRQIFFCRAAFSCFVLAAEKISSPSASSFVSAKPGWPGPGSARAACWLSAHLRPFMRRR